MKKSWKQLQTAAVQPLTPHLTNHPSKINDMLGTAGLISKILLWIFTNGHINVDWSARTYIYQYCMETRCSWEDLPRVMADRDRWWERVKGICANSMILPWPHHCAYFESIFITIIIMSELRLLLLPKKTYLILIV